jgi:hypothetical protein
MSNPQAPGKQGRKDSKNKAPQPHHQQAAGAPGQGEHHQASPRSGEHGQRHPAPSHPSHSTKEDE